ncbi:MAG: TraR/DksA family transcriptional regulator [Nitrospinota bacterium]|nr:TraR/DksA family transcriptional regulator [Nitrospinota bacterium]
MKEYTANMKQTLIERREQLLSHENSSIPESTDTREGDDIDQAGSAYEQEMAFIMKNREIEELKNINEALEKIKSGEYGECEECGDKINLKRLKAMPFVKYCVKCQANLEAEEK